MKTNGQRFGSKELMVNTGRTIQKHRLQGTEVLDCATGSDQILEELSQEEAA
jgi:hypothetical protein